MFLFLAHTSLTDPLSPRIGVHVGRIVIKNSNSDFADNNLVFIVLYAIDNFLRIPGLVLVHLAIFLATYHRATVYVGPSSQIWLVKKMVDGLHVGMWAIIFIAEVAWVTAGYVDYYIDSTLSNHDYAESLSTDHILGLANGSFYIFIHLITIVGIVMLNSASTSRTSQDSVVRTLMRAMLPALTFRTMWATATLVVNNTPGVIQDNYQSKIVQLVDAIADQLSLTIIIGVMIRLGSQNSSWGTPADIAPQPSPTPQQLQHPPGARVFSGAQEAMTMVIGPNGLPVLGTNGQPIFTPIDSSPASGPRTDATSLETRRDRSMYSRTSPPTTNNILPTQQHPQPQRVSQQHAQHWQLSRLPQPPAGYFYEPPAAAIEPPKAPKPDSQEFPPYTPQQLSAGAQGAPGQLQPSFDPYRDLGIIRPSQTQASIGPRVYETPATAPFTRQI